MTYLASDEPLSDPKEDAAWRKLPRAHRQRARARDRCIGSGMMDPAEPGAVSGRGGR
jgi:hypothetical protein